MKKKCKSLKRKMWPLTNIFFQAKYLYMICSGTCFLILQRERERERERSGAMDFSGRRKGNKEWWIFLAESAIQPLMVQACHAWRNGFLTDLFFRLCQVQPKIFFEHKTYLGGLKIFFRNKIIFQRLIVLLKILKKNIFKYLVEILKIL